MIPCPEADNHLRDTTLPETRIEYGHEGGPTLYCSACSKHFPLCFATQYMSPCILLRGHLYEHKDDKGRSWTE